MNTKPQPIRETTAGQVRGSVENGVQIFRGIPYGAPTGGANRFMPPKKPTPWTGIRDALSFAERAPQSIKGARLSALASSPFLAPVYAAGPGEAEGEDCLALNIWTPDVDSARLPVMVWLHGGGFTSGSGAGALYDGKALAARGDVVVVTVNHRLGALGFAELSGLLGPEFAASGNVGMLDIVAALEWVRDNIAAFGGDPARVLVFGESGGGQKVSALLAIPAAEGLFHRVVIESGPGFHMNTPEHAREIAETLLEILGLDRAHADELLRLPTDRILAAQAEIMAGKGRFIPGFVAGFAPVVDGTILPAHPFDPAAPSCSADVPVIVGYNRTELTLFLDAAAWDLDEAGLVTRTRALLGDAAGKIIEAYRTADPAATPGDLFILIATDYPTRAYTFELASRRARLGRASTYVYEFAWETPVGRMRSPHVLEIPFVFDNVETPAGRALTGGDPRAPRLAAAISDAWVNFAKSGAPGSTRLPAWPSYDPARRAMMIFNDESTVQNDPGRSRRLAFESVFGFGGP